ncbi:hypothetical protein Glove_82g74 [Diversispora epigaea]|uniref:Protein kinase domain-containing protein n=1 Tax=Diversispora epigaea TaxID=1348612 RepID=A0A397JIM6_9GLOM|nr:hypothetical protein Glove_82g74 [Diversispora epigaea]
MKLEMTALDYKFAEVINKAAFSSDFPTTLHERGEYAKNKIKNDSSLTKNEKKFILDRFLQIYDQLRVENNSEEKQQCNNCQNWHQAIQYCEYCIRKYLENNFGNWTSGNDEIDKLIQECQKKTLAPFAVIEWISYDQFENIEYLTEGGCASIYKAIWKGGAYDKWNSEKQILERYGRQIVILKRLNNSNSNNVKWFQEVSYSNIINKAAFSSDFPTTLHERGEYAKNKIKNDSSLTKNEKKFILDRFLQIYDQLRVENNSEEKQQCNNCQNWHQAIQYCEYCIRKYLENNFGNWTSGNDEIDKLIQECQKKTLAPFAVIEWISYDQFENIEYLTEGGCASIYKAIWKGGAYDKWNSEKQILERYGRQIVILKRLNNSNSNNVKWFQEVTFSFTLGNYVAECYGLTKDPITNDYLLVMCRYDSDLRHFLIDNYHTLTCLQKYKIIYFITNSLNNLHNQNIVHKDLHSGNFLYDAGYSYWKISDLGLSGPVEKPLNSIYGNLPYIAPEVLCGQIYTTKSDIYSLGILMWEIATGETPFGKHEHDSDLQFAIVNGYRPKIHKEIPQEYVTLMKQCWDANPYNRPDVNTIRKKMESLIRPFYTKKKNLKSKIKNFFKLKSSKIKNFFKLKSSKNKNKPIIKNAQLIKNTKSQVYTFSIQNQPRNATDEQETFDPQLNDLIISDEIDHLYHEANNSW